MGRRLVAVALALLLAPYAAALDTSVPTTLAGVAHLSFEVDGAGVVVAVLDTGVDDEHPDLAGRFVQGADASLLAVQGCINPDDTHGHGTHVASTAVGAQGVAPGAKLVDVKVSPDLAGASVLDGVTRGIDWVISYNAGDACGDPGDDVVDIISISFSTLSPGSPTDSVNAAVQRAVDAGIVVVVAAGNCGPGGDAQCTTHGDNSIGSPGVAYGAITVAAADDRGTTVRDDDLIAPYSSRGPGGTETPEDPKPNIAAPGSNIAAACYSLTSAADAGSDCVKSGTSMATPHVSGVAALLLHADPTLTPAEVKSAITTTAESRTGLAWDPTWGSGYVDADAAIRHVLQENLPPTAVIGTGPCAVAADRCIRFDASGSTDDDGSIALYAWDLGDGATSPDAVTEHTYAENGTYHVKLTVTDDLGASVTRHVNVTAASLFEDETPPNRVPHAVLELSSLTGTTQDTFNFSSLASSDEDGAIVDAHWYFGDGASITGVRSVNHTYDSPGTYDATLIVFDDDGASATASATVEVTAVDDASNPDGDPTTSATTPQVHITAPAHGSTVKAGDVDVSWSVTASSDIDHAKVLVDGAEIMSLDGTHARVTLTPGTHVLRVVVKGVDGGTGADEIQVTVRDPGGDVLDPAADAGNATEEVGDPSGAKAWSITSIPAPGALLAAAAAALAARRVRARAP